jgi:phenylacetate-CoA ligase
VTLADWVPVTATPGLAWPGLPPAAGLATLALQYQLDLSQWMPAPALEVRQFEQLRRLATFACRHVPRYRDLAARSSLPIASTLDRRAFLDWPILTKQDIQREPERHLAEHLPPEHGAIDWIATSGSTGTPLRAANAAIGIRMQHALLLRSHLWFGLEPRGKFAIIRAMPPKPMHHNWGAPDALAFATGPAVSFSAFEDHATQLDWIIREAPTHLLTLNANLRALIDLSVRTGRIPTGVRTVMGMSNIAAPDLADMARSHWNARYFQSYACSEMGSLALQCPRHDHLHVQSEHVLLEVLRPDGSPCDAGEIGRVVVTDLHNFAMPLIRYDIGDLAAFGAPCACGRGLPVLQVVAGRTGDLAIDPTGRRFFAHLVQDFWVRIAPIRQRQIIQIAPDRLEIRYVADRDLTDAESAELSAAIRRAMRFDYRIVCRRVPAIALGPGGKFVDFVGLDAAGGTDGQARARV